MTGSPATPRPLPLAGVRVLAVEQFGAGPFATSLLGDLGADVVKIENPREGGDSARATPPLTIAPGDSIYFQSMNRNKRSLALDLAAPGGRAVFERLVAGADVVFNNLRGDLPERLGLRYADLAALNPRVVCCSLSGFGTSGPRRAEPGYDPLVQAMTGYMALTGDPGGAPVKCGVSVIDFAAGYAATTGILAALADARSTGLGRDVEVALLETALHMLNYLAAWQLNDGYEPGRIADSGHAVLVPAQTFATADGWVAVVCFKEKFWELLCERLGRPELAGDPRFRRFPDRLANKAAVLDVLKPLFAARPTAHWVRLLTGSVPCAPVNDLATALADPQVVAREVVVELEHPTRGKIREVRSSIRVGGADMPRRPAPRLGEQTDEILREAGFDAGEIARLRQGGAVA